MKTINLHRKAVSLGIVTLTFFLTTMPAFAQQSGGISDGLLTEFINALLADGFNMTKGVFLLGILGLAMFLSAKQFPKAWVIGLVAAAFVVTMGPIFVKRYMNNPDSYQINSQLEYPMLVEVI